MVSTANIKRIIVRVWNRPLRVSSSFWCARANERTPFAHQTLITQINQFWTKPANRACKWHQQTIYGHLHAYTFVMFHQFMFTPPCFEGPELTAWSFFGSSKSILNISVTHKHLFFRWLSITRLKTEIVETAWICGSIRKHLIYTEENNVVISGTKCLLFSYSVE